MNKSDLVELKYLSRYEGDLKLSGLAAIVDASIASNGLNGITGILYFDYGYFGQILEGARAAIEATWGRIKSDPRHRDIELFGIKEIQERRFPEWSMKLFDSREFAETFPRFTEIITSMEHSDAENIRILKAFWREF